MDYEVLPDRIVLHSTCPGRSAHNDNELAVIAHLRGEQHDPGLCEIHRLQGDLQEAQEQYAKAVTGVS